MCFSISRWSYHNGGSWPTLLWQFMLACIKMGRPELARKALEVAEKRLSNNWWPEYYDTRTGIFIGKQSRLVQTSRIQRWHPSLPVSCKEDLQLLEGCACALTKGGRKKCSRHAVRSQVLV